MISLNVVCAVSRWLLILFQEPWHIQKTIFASMSPYFNDKLSLFLTEVNFETTEENQLSYFQNGYFFKILWWSHQPHNKGICRWRNEIISECFTINNHGFYLYLFQPNRLYIYIWISAEEFWWTRWKIYCRPVLSLVGKKKFIHWASYHMVSLKKSISNF